MLGVNNIYSCIDYFPLLNWLPLMLSGILAGYFIDEYYDKIKSYKISDLLSLLGRNCLALYTTHIILFMIIFKNAKYFIKN
jgi:uncharacterized membrane protein